MRSGLADLLAESHGTQANGGDAQNALTEGMVFMGKD